MTERTSKEEEFKRKLMEEIEKITERLMREMKLFDTPVAQKANTPTPILFRSISVVPPLWPPQKIVPEPPASMAFPVSGSQILPQTSGGGWQNKMVHLTRRRTLDLPEALTEIDTLRNKIKKMESDQHDKIKSLESKNKNLEMLLQCEKDRREKECIKSERYRIHVQQLEDNHLAKENELILATTQKEELDSKIRKLEERADILKPLVVVGAVIRLRFLEQAKEQCHFPHHGRWTEEAVIQKGNKAAHGGNQDADFALIKGGFESNDRLDSTKTILKDLYSLHSDIDHEYQPWFVRHNNCEATIKTLGNACNDNIKFNQKMEDYNCLQSRLNVANNLTMVQELVQGQEKLVHEMTEMTRRRRRGGR